MSFASDLLPDIENIRGIPDDLGMRPHTVDVITGIWSGDHTGDGSLASTSLRLVPTPKVRWLTNEQVVVAGLPNGAVSIGPITPSFPDIAELSGTLLSAGNTFHLRLIGPNHPNGAVYRVTNVTADRAFRYTLIAVPVSE